MLALSEATPSDIQEALPPEESLPLAPYRALMPLLCDPDAEILLAGRVGSATWAYLERDTACRVRLVSEERGLASAPKGHRACRSWGGYWRRWACNGSGEELAALADGVVLDTRVLLAHADSRAGREDRFQSDLLAPGEGGGPVAARPDSSTGGGRYTSAARGHSLLSGGLMALTDQAWLENAAGWGLAEPAP